MPIRRLPDTLANQIAAGEVIERPASVVKELLENSLDAGATSVRISTENAGLTGLEVLDNGKGIPQAELKLALERHATSKIETTEDLFRLNTFGFRGEALPSIASVARLTLTSRPETQPEAWQVTPEGHLKPAALPPGTRVQVADLFYATPARRKFLKSARAERSALHAVVTNAALAYPHATFTLVEDGVETWHLPAAQGDFLNALTPRLATLLGGEFAAHAQPIGAANAEGWSLGGFISPPTAHAATAREQYFFVNGRPVKDRTLQTALKQAYADRLPAGRHPMALLFLNIPAEEVDVNVHPAKSEVRFRNRDHTFGFLYAAVRQALGAPKQSFAGGQGAHTAPFAHLSSGQPMPLPNYQLPMATLPQQLRRGDEPSATRFEIPAANGHIKAPMPEGDAIGFLGAAIGQVANTFILAETADGNLTIIDQHAAHERIVYEQLKTAQAAGAIPRQPLLLPTLVTLKPTEVDTLLANAADLDKLGLELEGYSPTAVTVTAMPAALGNANPLPLVNDVARQLSDFSPRTVLHEKLDHLLSTFACHHSIRAARRLSLAEMNALLRQMEANPATLTCNHGRPTTATFAKSQLEKMFDRS
ncbi:MAG TPA: DNA mismatch repair endonuclease MutL [Alphaproteobacteria bacterium]|nr:DNA mismatch repair endonuclease MutL [Alphaproteobacteria bacterium]